MHRARERVMRLVFLATACVSILAVALICLFLLAQGVPALADIGLRDFLFGREWSPQRGVYGILPMILGSLYVTAGALAVGVPIGLLTAVFLACFCPPRLRRVLRAAVDLLAGIPSVVYGFFGLWIVVPWVRELFGGSGSSLLAASLLLGFMILPTVVAVSDTALRAVPCRYAQGAQALGASREAGVFFVVVPAARPGLVTAAVLGLGRAVGETMAVIMVAGNQARMPAGLTQGVRTLTANIVLEMGYASGLHRGALVATALVLLVFILLITLSISLLRKGEGS